MVTKEMIELLNMLSNLCYRAGDEVFENEETRNILNACDDLGNMIDDFLEKERGIDFI